MLFSQNALVVLTLRRFEGDVPVPDVRRWLNGQGILDKHISSQSLNIVLKRLEQYGLIARTTRLPKKGEPYPASLVSLTSTGRREADRMKRFVDRCVSSPREVGSYGNQ